MSNTNELINAEPTTNALALMQLAVERGADPKALEQLCELQWKIEERNAKREFAAAFAALQTDLRRNPVVATRVVPDRNGNVRYKFAPLEEILATAGPLLDRHGFSVSFDTRYTDQPIRIVAKCTLTHTGGHDRSNEFAARVAAPPQCNDAQADGSTRSYAKRYALCDALGIAIEHDDDARAEGGEISEEQAAELESRARACGADIARLLKFANATSFVSIRLPKYRLVVEQLVRKEQATK